ncbi:MAG: glycosyltransferase family 4 protein [Chlamydiae bacterium]|nr:glycosyltransferase family 4 protein [Chlamydiota bacterium]MBI3276596.1 glycosyltransferase family 4 protein [Chlamydiota bacterium]
MPLLKEKISPDSCLLKEEFKASGPILMYVGNLEFYQGIDLLLESFALVLKETRDVDLVVVGGEDADILKYRKVALHLHIQEKVHFLGPKPVECLGDYLAQADILVSPRLKGRNTPMKLYSYLASGKPTLATDLETHTQVLDREIAELASPSLDAFSKGMLRLIRDSSLREQLGVAGKSRVDEKYSYKAFQKKLNDLYGELEAKFQS